VSGGPQPARSPAGVVGPGIAVLIVLVGLIGLGNWQLDRKVWKEDLIARLGQRLAAAPSELPPPGLWSSLSPATDEFRRVRFAAQVLPHEEALVFTSGSAFRPDVSGSGYWVFAPARVAGGALVMVNRGFVPEGKQDQGARPGGQFSGPVSMIGVLRWPEQPGLFTPTGDPARNIWFARDSAAMAAAKGITAAPFYVELESPEPPGGLPHAGRLKPNLPNNHFGYALTWLGLAAVLVGVYGAWLFGGWRKQDGIAGSGV